MSVSVPLCDKSLFKGVQPSWIHCIVLKTGRILCAHHDSYLGGKNVRNKRSIIYHHWAVKALPSLSLFVTLKPPPGKIRWANLKDRLKQPQKISMRTFVHRWVAVVSSEEAWDWWTFCQPSLGGSGLMKKISFKLWNGPRFDAFQAPLCPPLAGNCRDFTVSEDLLYKERTPLVKYDADSLSNWDMWPYACRSEGLILLATSRWSVE